VLVVRQREGARSDEYCADMSSLNRPGGNITGLFFLGGVVSTKRMELLRELVPQKRLIGVVLDSGIIGERQRADLQAATQANGQDFIFPNASTEAAFDSAFATFAERGELPGIVADMIHEPVAVIIGNIAAAQAAKSGRHRAHLRILPVYLSNASFVAAYPGRHRRQLLRPVPMSPA
jgi:hypothetical protein